MTMQDILTQVASGNLKADEAGKLLSTLGGGSARKATLKVARNKSGGAYFIHPKVKGYSDTKHKEYVATVNFPKGVAESLFAEDATLLEIAEAMRALFKSEIKAAA